MILNSKKDMAGRPTKNKQSKIRMEIFELRARGYEASYIMAKTGYSKNTVYTYIKEFEEIRLIDDQITIETLQSRILYDMDKTIDELYSRLDILKKEEEALRAKGKQVPKYIHSLILDIIKSIAEIKGKKWSILGGPAGKNFVINKSEMNHDEQPS